MAFQRVSRVPNLGLVLPGLLFFLLRTRGLLARSRGASPGRCHLRGGRLPFGRGHLLRGLDFVLLCGRICRGGALPRWVRGSWLPAEDPVQDSSGRVSTFHGRSRRGRFSSGANRHSPITALAPLPGGSRGIGHLRERRAAAPISGRPGPDCSTRASGRIADSTRRGMWILDRRRAPGPRRCMWEGLPKLSSGASYGRRRLGSEDGCVPFLLSSAPQSRFTPLSVPEGKLALARCPLRRFELVLVLGALSEKLHGSLRSAANLVG
jgi:hypothetical protein